MNVVDLDAYRKSKQEVFQKNVEAKVSQEFAAILNSLPPNTCKLEMLGRLIDLAVEYSVVNCIYLNPDKIGIFWKGRVEKHSR